MEVFDMFSDMNEKLTNVKEKVRLKKKWEDHLMRAEQQLLVEEKKRRELSQYLEKEKKDHERLKNFSLMNLLYTLQGKKVERLREGKRELEAASLKYQEAEATIIDLNGEIQEYQRLITPLKGSKKEFDELLLEKERLIKDSSTIWSEQLYELVDKASELQMMLNEYKEAIVAGNHAMRGLSEALESLNKAKNWSTFDMFGGGMITTHMKHSNLDSARDDIHQVQRQLRHFQDELLDLKEHFHIDLEIGNMLTFADYFFDGLIVDWMVHGKINDALAQTETMLQRTNMTLQRLEDDKQRLERQHIELEQKKLELIENV